MRIAVLGGTGKTGQELLARALAAGHEVAALVRSPEKLTGQDERLDVIVGDALNADDVARAVADADAVISLIGPTKGGVKDVASRSTAHMLSAMREHGVPRIVVASVGGIPTPDDQRDPLAKVLGGVIKLVLGEMYADRERQLALLRESDREWVAVRLPRLTDEPATGKTELSYDIKPSYSVPRADVARVMLAQVTDDTYVGHAPIVHA